MAQINELEFAILKESVQSQIVQTFKLNCITLYDCIEILTKIWDDFILQLALLPGSRESQVNLNAFKISESASYALAVSNAAAS